MFRKLLLTSAVLGTAAFGTLAYTSVMTPSWAVSNASVNAPASFADLAERVMGGNFNASEE